MPDVPTRATRWRSSPRRKLACLFWCLLTAEQDYAYAQPSLTRKKLRRLELRAGGEWTTWRLISARVGQKKLPRIEGSGIRFR